MSVAVRFEATPVTATPVRTSRVAVPVTVVIPTFNEADQITAAVQSLQWADQVIVVDGGSDDGTAALAAAAGASVITVVGQTIAAQRNAGIVAARNDWILALDADERASTALRLELAAVVRHPTHAAYTIRFQNFFLGRELRHGPYGRDWHIRLFQRNRRYRIANVHERLEPIADVGALTGRIIHRPFRDLPHYLTKVIRYARWGAQDVQSRGCRVSAAHLVIRPLWRFGRDYIILGAWMDGLPGFLVSAFAGVGTLLKYGYVAAEQTTCE
jgi:glycosyltransferase involved in cell wall biosynthesis